MSKPLNLFQHGWQFVVDSLAGKPANSSAAPSLLQNLEDRLLYDASPLAGLISPPGDSVEILDSLDQQLTNLMDFCAQEDAECPILADQFVESCFVLDSCLMSTITPVNQQAIFVDESVAGYESLIEDVISQGVASSSFQVVQLNQFEDGIEQISRVLSGGQQFSAVHIISHGNDGRLELGNSQLTIHNMHEYQQQLSTWNSGLSDGADILLYGCEIASSVEGQSLVEQIGEWTGADIAASDDLTGAAELGGDWDFEYVTGAIESDLAFSYEARAAWGGVLGSITVDTTSDVLDGDADTSSLANLALTPGSDGFVSLREAIVAANTDSGADTINLGAGIYTLGIAGTGDDASLTGDLDITDELTITGAASSATIIDGGGDGLSGGLLLDRVFHVISSSLTISDVTVQHGEGDGVGDSGGGFYITASASLDISDAVIQNNRAYADGGGIYNLGTLTMDNVTVADNRANVGGGLNNQGVAVVTNSTFSDNLSSFGGGIRNETAGANLTLTNVTISGNTATWDGGGLNTSSDSLLNNVTIANNSANQDGGGIFVGNGGFSTKFTNNLVAGNTAVGTGPDIDGSVDSGGFNLVSNSSSSGGWVGSDILDVSPTLGALTDNGGSTQTHALLAGSRGIDEGTNTGAPATDQRGTVRDAGVDIGAFEFVATPGSMQMITGSYVGDGVDGLSITGLGFDPHLVIIKQGTSGENTVARTAAMTGDVTKSFVGGIAEFANGIESLDSDGFTLGNDATVNTSGQTYYWTAFKSAVGEMSVGSYTGDGLDNRSITGVGFQGDYAIIMGAGAHESVQRFQDQTGDASMEVGASAVLTNVIQAFEADGFQVGTDARVNQAGQEYYYVTWNEVAGKTEFGIYAGDGIDNKAITDVGFAPEYVLVTLEGAGDSVHRPDSLTGDNTLGTGIDGVYTDGIQQYLATGFEVGTHITVNWSGQNYYYAAFNADVVNSAPTDIVFDSESDSETQVNTYTNLDQKQGEIAAFDDGSYIVVWASDGQDGSGYGIYAQRYNADHSKLGVETLVTSEQTDDEVRPSVTTFSDGGFVVAWQDSIAGSRAWTEARVFNADATPATAEFVVSPGTNATNEGYTANVLALDANNFVAIWNNEIGGVTYELAGQIFDRTGVTVGAQFSIGALGSANALFSPDANITLLDDGGFATIWRTLDGVGTTGTSMRVMNADGSARSAELILAGDNHGDITTLSNGNFVVTYRSGTDLKAAIYDATGSVVTAAFDVNTTASGGAFLPAVTHSDDGFVIAWQSTTGDGDSNSILAQRFDSAGNRIDGEVLVNQTSAGNQKSPEMVELASGEIRVVWESENVDGSGFAIASRTLATGTASINENSANGTRVANIIGVSDPDLADTHTFALINNAGGRFAINNTTGEITVANGSLLDYETDTSHDITVRVTDSASNTYDEVLTISINDVSEAPTDLVATATTNGGLSLNEDGGNDAYLLAGDGGAIFGGLTSTTMEFQFSSTTVPPDGGDADFITYAAVAGSGNDVWFGVWRNDAGSGYQLGLGVNGAYQYATGYDASVLFDGMHQTVSVTWDNASGDYEFFVDGVSVGSGTSFEAGHTIAGGGELVIGMEQDTVGGGFQSNQVFQGTLHDARIFNDVRTLGEIVAGTNQTLSAAEPGMVANWTFNDLTTGGVVIDTVSGNDLSVMHASGAGFITSGPTLSMSISENAVDTSVVATMGAIDPDSGETFTYTLLDNAGGRFAINSTTGEITVANGSLLDFETASSHNITVAVTDSASNTYAEVLAIDVSNVVPTVISATGTGSVSNGGSYTLNLSANEDVSSWTINWGDGTVETIVGDPSTAAHIYNNPGMTYQITASATDSDGTWSPSNLLTADYWSGNVFELDFETGVQTFDFTGSPSLTGPSDVVVGPDGHIYVAGYTSDTIEKYDGTTGAFVSTFATSVNNATGLAWGPDGNLYVGNYANDRIDRYDGTDGTFLGIFADGTGTLDGTMGLTFGTNGNLFATGWFSHNVVEFDGATGVMVGEFVTQASGVITTGTDLIFGPDGNLYVNSHNTSTIQEFDGTTGVHQGTFATVVSPFGLTLGPDGNFYVSGDSNDAITIIDGQTGNTLGVFADTPEGLAGSWMMNFRPMDQVTVDANNAPTLTDGGSTSTFEGGSTAPFFGVATVADVDSADFDGGILTATISSGGEAADKLSLLNAGGVSTSGSDVLVSAVIVGTWSGGTGGTPLTITFNTNASVTEVQAVYQAIRFETTSDDPTLGVRTISVAVTDGDGGTSNTGTATVDLNTAVNDAPTANIVASAFGVNEDDGYRPFGGFSVSDIDDGGADVSFTLSVNDGVINLTNTTGLTLTGGANNSATMTFTGSVSDINTALGTVTYKPDADFNGTDAVTLSVNDLGNTGGGPLSDSDNANILVSARNDAPTINDGASVGLPGTNEDSASAGATVSAIVNVASWNDVDSGAVRGMAITGMTGNGTWQYSEDGITWISFGGVTSSNALLLDATSQVRYLGDGDNGEVPTFDFRAWDTTTGTASTNATPSYANPGAGGGTSAFSSESASASTTVTNVNDAPVLNGTPILNLDPVSEDPDAPVGAVGTLVSSLVDLAGGGGLDNVTDADSGALTGIAVTQAATGLGTWYYSTDDGANWNLLVGATNSNALLLAANSRLYFEPNTDFTGLAVNPLNFRAWDQTSGTNGNFADTTVNGGTSAFSSVVEFVSVPVTPVNDSPTIGTNTGTTVLEGSTGTAITTAMLNEGDVDDSGIGLTYTITDVTDNGTLYLSGFGALGLNDTFTQANIDAGDVTYDHDGSETISDSFDFSLADGGENGSTPATGTFNIMVTPVSDAPVESTIEGTNVAYTENDAPTQITNTISIADIDDTNIESAVVQITVNYANGQDVLAFIDTGTITGVWNAIAGTLTLTGSDTLANYEAALRSVTYENTSDNPTNLTRTVSFTVNDGDVDSDNLSRDIDVAPVNDASVVTLDPTTLAYASGAINIDPTLTVTDVDDSMLVSAVVRFSNGFLQGEDTLVFVDQLGITGSLSGNGRILTLTGVASVADYETALRSVQYENVNPTPTLGTLRVRITVDDGSDVSVAANRTVEIIDDEPPRASDDSGTVAEGGAVMIDLAANDSDNNDLLDLASITIISGPANGSIVDNGDGTVTYTHDGSETLTDSFVYTIKDDLTLESNQATVSVTVTPVNDDPTITTTTFNSAENQTSVGTVLSTDDDGGVPTYTITGGADQTDFNLTPAGVLTFNTAQDFENPTDAGTDGIYEVQVTADDGNGGTDVRTILVTVTDDNDAPIITTTSFNSTENQTSVGNVLATDQDGDVPTYTITGGADQADFNLTPAGVLTFSTAQDFENPTDADTDGVYEVQVTADDGNGGTDVRTILITITDDNDAPVITTTTFNSAENQTSVGNMLASDQDGDVPTYTITGGADQADFNLTPAGVLTFSTAQDFENPTDANTDGVYEVQVTANDGNGGTDVRTILVTITDDNDAPIITTTTFNSAENQTSVGNMLASDQDGDVSTYTITGGADQADFNLSPAGVLTFNTAQDFENPTDADSDGVYEVQVTANDGNGGTDVRTILVTITDDNDAPVITTTTFNSAENQTSVGNMLASDDDGDIPTYTITGGVDQADFNLTPAGVLTFNTAQDFENPTDADSDGVYEVQVTADDGNGGTDVRTILVTVTDDNDAPIITTTSFNSAENQTSVGNMLASDQDGDVSTYTITGGADQADFNLTPAGVLTFNTAQDFENPTDADSDGVYEVQVTANDGNGGTDVRTILVTITDDNDAPIITTTSFNAAENQTSVGSMLANDQDGDVPTYSIIGGADQADFNLTPAGVLTFNTAQDFENPTDADTDGVYEVQVTANDGNGGTDVRTILVTITDDNDAPVIITTTFNSAENQTSVGNMLASDDDGDIPTYTITGGADQADFNLTPAGVLTFNTAQDFENPTDADSDGVYEVQVTANDGNGGTNVRTILVTLTDANDAPVVTTTNFSAAENQTSIGALLSTDDDGDVPTYTITGGADQADFNLTPAGVLTFNTAQDFDNPTDGNTDGIYEVQVTANDGNGGTDVRTILVTVTDDNDAPVITTTNFNSAENQTSIGTLLSTDADGDIPTYTITGGADQADFNLTPTGVLTFNTVQDFENATDADTDGIYEVQVTANDGNGGTDVRTILVTVTDDNDAPVIITTNFNAAENQTSIGNLLSSDDDGDAPTYTITGGADQADFNLTSAGVLTFSTAQDFENPADADSDGIYEVQVTANDGNGGTDAKTILVTVTDDNDGPVITTTNFSAAENQTSIGSVLSTDEDGDVPTYTITGGADQTDFNLTPAGVLTFNTAQDFENPADANSDGIYEVQVTANDGNGGTDVRTILVTVTDENDAPVITTTNFNAAENQTSVGTVLASDEDGDVPTYTITGGADQADFILTPAGVLTFNTAQDFENPTDADSDGVYEVQVTANDGNGGTDVRTILITVTDDNDAPIITNTNFNSAENQTAVGNLLSSDEDGDVPTYTITGGADQADFNLTPAGVLTFNTGQDFENPTDADSDGVYEVQITADDGNGGIDVRTIRVTITDVNEIPTDIAPNSFAIDENTDTTVPTSLGTLTAADQDSGETFTYTIVGGADAANFSIGGAGDELMISDGVLDFETKSTYSVVVRVTDSGGLTYDENLTINVNDLNEVPTDIAPKSFAIDENIDTTIPTSVGTLTAADQDGVETFSYTIVGGADAANFSIGGAGDELMISDGVLDFETKATYSVIVRVTDSGGLTYDENLTVNVNDLNEVPTDIAPNSFAIDENTDTTLPTSLGTLTATDEDSGETFTYTIVGGADAASFSIGGAGDELMINDGVLDFETKSTYSVVVRVTDSGGLAYDETLTVSVNDLNEVPTDIAPNSFAIDENSDTTVPTSVGTLTATDEDGGETFTYSIVGGADAASFSIGGAGDELMISDGVLDFETKSTYSVIVRVTDSGGLSYDETLAVDVNDLNENPAINDQAFAVNENSSNGSSVGFATVGDVDAGDSVSFAITGGSGATVFAINGTTGEITVTDVTQLDFETAPVFTLTVEVTDTGGLTDTATITINLNDINDEQVLVTNLPLSVNEGLAATIDGALLETTDQDHGPASLTYTVTAAPANGTLLLSGVPTLTFTQADIDNGRLTYLHNGSETTVDSFDFSFDDGVGSASLGTFLIMVNPINDAPVASDDGFSLNEGATRVGPSADLLGNDSDPELDALAASLVSGPVNGSLVLNRDGSFTYTHDGSETTTDSFQYRLDDGSLNSNVATVLITVVPVNDAPIGVGDSYVTPSGLELRELVGVLANDSDAESDPINAILMTNPTNGTVLLNANGSFRYIPENGFFGNDGFAYIPNDGSLSGSMTFVSVEVAAVPPPDINPIDPTDPPVDPPTDPPVEPPIDSTDPDPAEQKSDPSDDADPVTKLLVNAIPQTVSTSGIGDLSQFESIEEVKEYIELLADRQQAEAVLRMLVSNSSPDVIQDREDIRRLRLASGIGVAFDANYLWNQLKDLEDDRFDLASLHATVGTITTVGALGYLFWSLRGGVLIAAALSQLPTWRMIDPLPVLESYAVKKEESEGGSLEDFFA